MRYFFAFSVFSATLVWASAAHALVSIQITSTGFSTTSVHIAVGETIRWENSDETPHWPASNLHPTHALYSEFDPKRPIEPQSSWSFTFDKPGTWRFHDHLYPTLGGVIYVGTTTSYYTETPKGNDIGFVASFLGRIYDKVPKYVVGLLSYDTKYQLVEYIAYHASPEAALKFVNERFDQRKDTVATIHGIKHVIGHALYDTYGLRGLPTCKSDIAGFDGSCYHGFMEKFLTTQDLEKTDMGIFAKMCTSDMTTGDCLDLHHGVGHGLASYFGLDRKKALDECMRVPTPEYRYLCMSGVNMEWSETVPYAVIEEWRGSAWKKCLELKDVTEVSSCAYELPRIFAFLHEKKQNISFDMYADGEAVGKGCASAPSRALKILCFQGAGFMAATRDTPKYPTPDICEHLGNASSRDVRVCMISAAQRLAVLNIHDTLRSRIDGICDRLKTGYDWYSCTSYPAEDQLYSFDLSI